MNNDFTEKQNNWWRRLITCRSSLAFHRATMVKALKSEQVLVGNESQKNSAEDIDFAEFSDILVSYKKHVVHDDEVVRRAMFEENVLKNLATEGLEHGYLGEYE